MKAGNYRDAFVFLDNEKNSVWEQAHQRSSHILMHDGELERRFGDAVD